MGFLEVYVPSLAAQATVVAAVVVGYGLTALVNEVRQLRRDRLEKEIRAQIASEERAHRG